MVLESYWLARLRPPQCLKRPRVMFAAALLVVSIVALSQFALYYWRSVLAGVASQPVSGRVLEAACVRDGHVSASDFDALAVLNDLTPRLEGAASGLTTVRL